MISDTISLSSHESSVLLLMWKLKELKQGSLFFSCRFLLPSQIGDFIENYHERKSPGHWPSLPSLYKSPSPCQLVWNLNSDF